MSAAVQRKPPLRRGGDASRGLLAARRTERRDTADRLRVLLALLAGWAMNFVSVKQLSLSLGSFIAHATARQA